jgi:hypothetical protein
MTLAARRHLRLNASVARPNRVCPRVLRCWVALIKGLSVAPKMRSTARLEIRALSFDIVVAYEILTRLKQYTEHMNGLSNRREYKRRRCGIIGSVQLPRGVSIICRVYDVSHNGARITSSIADLPKSFKLSLSADRQIFRDCHVVWQRGLEFGVAFKARETIALR